MIEKVTWKGQLLAIIIRANYMPEGTNFVTESDSPLQLGVIHRQEGDEVKPHIHQKTKRTTYQVQEVLHVDSGKVEARFYDGSQKIAMAILGAGDTILLASGGHGFSFLEESKIIEVKQGPYLSAEKDQRILDGAS